MDQAAHPIHLNVLRTTTCMRALQASTSTSTSSQGQQAAAAVPLLPEKHYGSLRGGRYPFLYDPGYGLPVVREVATYGSVLAAIRENRVTDILWFSDVTEVSADAVAPAAALHGASSPSMRMW